jgi:hypothetical protein
MKRDRSPTSHIRFTLCLCAALVLATSTARAAIVSAPGNSCQAGFNTGSVFHDDVGAENDNTGGTMSFMCPLAWGTTSSGTNSVSIGQLAYVDHSSSYNFSCYVTRTSQWGSQYWSVGKYTCSVAGGCADPTSSYTGVNYLIWFSNELGSNITTNYYSDGISFRCDVPRATSHTNSGRSGVLSYALY